MVDFGDLIPVVAILSWVAFAWIGLRHRELKLANRRVTIEAEQESEEKKRLEARLAVLERIVTDRGLQTAEQIEALRDAPDLARETNQLREI
jgi:hypothetical protein